MNQFAQIIQNQKFLKLLRLRCDISWLTDAGRPCRPACRDTGKPGSLNSRNRVTRSPGVVPIHGAAAEAT